jgi:hypothetical protein
MSDDNVSLLRSAAKNNDVVLKFVNDVVAYAKKHSIKLRVVDEKNVDGQYAGYFSSEDPNELAIAVKKPLEQWVSVLLHELNHAVQNEENSALFGQLGEGEDEFYTWVSGEMPKHFDKQASLMKSLFIESDCEQRTVNSIVKYGLQDLINPVEYAQKANTYVTFYKYVARKRKWNAEGKTPYEVKNVWKLFPTKVELFGCPLRKKYREAFEKCMK